MPLGSLARDYGMNIALNVEEHGPNLIFNTESKYFAFFPNKCVKTRYNITFLLE